MSDSAALELVQEDVVEMAASVDVEQSPELKPVTTATVKPSAPANTPKKQAKAQKRARPTRAEKIESQANPTTRLAGRQKTLQLPLSYKSDILHEFLLLNQATMLDAYERLGALMRMVSNTPELYAQVKDWTMKNVQLAQAQLSELKAQREQALEDFGDFEMPNVNVPESFHTTFEASHPIANTMVALLRCVDDELNQCENIYLANLVDDMQYRKLMEQATTIIRGTVDRIFKATNPGKRKENGRYNPAQLAAWLREGNKLIFADIPQHLRHIVEGSE